MLSALKKVISPSRLAETVPEFCQRTAEDVRTFIGFDRVMVYRFDPDLSGHIIAEAKRADLESYVGLHYPSSDIPKQARELFRLSKLRLIPDLSYAPVPLVPSLRPGATRPLDMSFCVTRSVSPIHVEYLQNMGVQASMSISVVIDDELWGLFSCHHYSPRYVPHASRAACDFLAHALAILVAGRQQAEDFAYTKRLHENLREINHATASERNFVSAIRAIDRTSIGGIEADGAALLSNGEVCLKGRTPGAAAVRELAALFCRSISPDVWSTDRLAEHLPAAAVIARGASGMLAARLSRTQPDYLFWFRDEVLHTVKWAGETSKTVTAGPLGDRLTPRKSFALWQQEVRGRSQPWLPNEIVAAENLRNSYHELYSSQTEALVQAMRAKDNFLAALSHELRTPLNPALLIASEEAGNNALPEAVRKNFAAIRDNIELEARLIDDLLDLSRISHGKLKLDLKPLDLHVVLHQALAILASEFESKPVALNLKLVKAEAVVNADVVRLLQVFWNVLKNAVKFTPACGQVTVESRIDPLLRRVSVQVSDTGIGLTAEEIPKIFAAFEQGAHAQTHSHRFGGLGLGLAISQSLLVAHTGRIYVESAGKDKGATFTIELPLALAGSAPPFDTPHAVADSSNPLLPAQEKTKNGRIPILLVEDHAATRASLSMIMELRGYEVSQAATMAAGMACAVDREFALVISDIGLPDGDGFTFMRELRKLRPGIKAIAMSGYGMESDRQSSIEAGFAELLLKPVNIQALEQALASVLKRRQA